MQEALTRVAPRLSELFSANVVLVRRVDLPRERVDTIALEVWGDGSEPDRTRTIVEPASMSTLKVWLESSNAIHRVDASASDALTRAIVPNGIAGDIVAGPLSSEAGATGILLAVGPRNRRFSDADVTVFRQLLEPFSVALENDRRFHELAKLREATEADNRALLSRLQRHDISESIVGESNGLRGVMERVEQVARADAPVLILGETGSGKEVIARAIHTRSRRADGPIVRVNCGAIPSELIDSELFGHERGSFTGAVAARKGWFERADGGTLFLDEVGELPLAAQVRLLRILQDGSLERVGGQRPILVDVRIVAATHRDLEAMVADGTFRQDLWYRISVFPLRLPPLRERLEDIPALAAHFAARAGLRLAGIPLVPSADDVGLLLRYPWPGNVRELASVIERAAILGDGKSLKVGTALGFSRSVESARPPPPQVPMRSASAPPPPPLPLSMATPTSQADDLSLEAAMSAHIERALVLTNGRIEGPNGAAALLGINPHTLRARMRKMKIDWARFRTHAG